MSFTSICFNTLLQVKMNLVEDCTCNNVFLIPYKNGNSRGIGLVEVLWKMVTEIMNFFLMVVIQFHNTLHSFRIVGGHWYHLVWSQASKTADGYDGEGHLRDICRSGENLWFPRLQSLPVNIWGLRSGIPGHMPPLEILGPPDNVWKGLWVLRGTF